VDLLPTVGLAMVHPCPADVQPLDVVTLITNKIPELTRNRWQKSYNTGGRYDLYVSFDGFTTSIIIH
jgi:hypothetical protein